jgi:hypothetical protein
MKLKDFERDERWNKKTCYEKVSVEDSLCYTRKQEMKCHPIFHFFFNNDRQNPLTKYALIYCDVRSLFEVDPN